MTFKDFMMKVRRAALCCGQEKRPTLEISGPTDVRRGVLQIDGLTKEQEDFIREKASASAARLLSLTSHPPTAPGSPLHSPSTFPNSPCSSREPSVALLNSASANLPTTLPTPPRQQHSDSNLPVSLPPSAHNRMKGFWERTRRLSNTMSIHSHGGGYQGVAQKSDKDHDGGENDDSVVLLNLDFKDTDSKIELESPVSTCGKSMEEGFIVQEVVGGHTKLSDDEDIKKAIRDIEIAGDSSSDDDEACHGIAKMMSVAEARPLVRA